MTGEPSRGLWHAELLDVALEEDVGSGDRTTRWAVPQGARGVGEIVTKEDVRVAGTDVARAVFHRVDPGLEVEVLRSDGEAVSTGGAILSVRGSAAPILTAERTALNFLARLSGVATLTHRFVREVEGTRARIVDTRKTTPGWRLLEKAAVRAGGGTNHRVGLHDMVLVKENHIAAAGGVGAALRRVRERNAEGLPVEIEVTTLGELEEALSAGADRILLDNMDPPLLRAAVERARRSGSGSPLLEASGGVSLETVREIAETGVDLISVGALTHSARAADLSLTLRIEGGGTG